MDIIEGWNNAKYWGGVLFKAKQLGYLAAVDIGCPYGNYEYDVRVYQTTTDTLAEGLIYAVSGEADLAGYHTVDLSGKPIYLQEDQEFFVEYRISSGI